MLVDIIPRLVETFGSDCLMYVRVLNDSLEQQELFRLSVIRAAADGKAILYFQDPLPQLCVEAYRVSSNALNYMVDFANCEAVACAAAVDKLLSLAPLRLAASLQSEVIARLFEKEPERAVWPNDDWHKFVHLLGWKVGVVICRYAADR